ALLVRLFVIVFDESETCACPATSGHEQRIRIFRRELVHAFELAETRRCDSARDLEVVERIDCGGTFARALDLTVEQHLLDAARRQQRGARHDHQPAEELHESSIYEGLSRISTLLGTERAHFWPLR